MLSALLWLLAGLALLILLVMCTPLRLGLRFDTAAKPVAQVKISLFGGLLPIPLPRKTEARKQKKTAKRGGMRVNMPALLGAAPRLLSHVIARIKFEMVRARIGFGFDNPADTGMLYGMLTPLERTIGSGQTARIVLHPDFDRERLYGEGQIAARFIPLAILPPVIRFGWTVFLQPKLKRVLP